MTRVLALLVVMFAVWFAAPAPANACIGLGCTCTVSAQDLAFGVYNPLSSTPNTTSSDISVTCGAQVAIGFSYDIKLSAGGSGNVNARQLSSSNDTMSYQIYKDQGYGTIFGNANAGGAGYISDGLTLTISLLSRTIAYPIYGRVPALQNKRAGSYADTITVTVDY